VRNSAQRRKDRITIFPSGPERERHRGDPIMAFETCASVAWGQKGRSEGRSKCAPPEYFSEAAQDEPSFAPRNTLRGKERPERENCMRLVQLMNGK